MSHLLLDLVHPDTLAEMAFLAAGLLKFTLALAACWVVHLCLAYSRPQWRVWVWRCSSIALLITVVLSWFSTGIHWQLAAVPSRTPERTGRFALSRLNTTGLMSASEKQDSRHDTLGKEALTPLDEPRATAATNEIPGPDRRTTSASLDADAQEEGVVSKRPSPVISGISVIGIAVIAWCMGFVIGMMRLCIGIVRLRRLITKGQVASPSLQADARRVAVAVGYRRPLHIILSPSVTSPCLAGVIRPTILLPPQLCDPTQRRSLKVVLAHEICHIGGFDHVWNLWFHLVALACWFHPLTWRIPRVHSEACDLACDARAALSLGSISDYRSTLARLVLDSVSSSRSSLVLNMVRPSSISRRMAALVRPDILRPLRRENLVAVSSAWIIILTFLGTVRVTQAKPAPSKEPATITGASTELVDAAPPSSPTKGTAAASSLVTPAHLLPPTTVGYVHVADLQQLRLKWQQTTLAQMLSTEQVDHLSGMILDSTWNRLMCAASSRLALSWRDLLTTSCGQVGWAITGASNDSEHHAVIALVDFQQHPKGTQQLVKYVSGHIKRLGGKQDSVTIGTHTVKRCVWTLEDRQNTVYLCVTDSWLLACDDSHLLESVLARLDNRNYVGSLQSTREFKATACRQSTLLVHGESHVSWFLAPMKYAMLPDWPATRVRHDGRSVFIRNLKQQGFDGIQAIGGHVCIATAGQQVAYDAFVYVPRPLTAGAQMLDFPCSNLTLPPDWVPADVSFCLTYNWELRDAFNRSRPLINQLLCAGSSEDLFEEILDGLQYDHEGPMVDVRTEFIPHLGNRVTVIGRPTLGRTLPDAFLLAIAIDNEQKMKATLKRFVECDPDTTTWQVHGRDVYVSGGTQYLAVENGQLFWASNASLLDEVLRDAESQPPRQPGLADRSAANHWQRVTTKLGGDAAVLLGYGLPDSLLNAIASYGSGHKKRNMRVNRSRENIWRHGAAWFTVTPCPNGWCLQGTISQ